MSSQLENLTLGTLVVLDGVKYEVIEHEGSLALREVGDYEQNEIGYEVQYQAEDRQQQAAALVAEMQSQGYTVDEEMMTMIMNGQLGNSDFQTVVSVPQQTSEQDFDKNVMLQNSNISFGADNTLISSEMLLTQQTIASRYPNEYGVMTQAVMEDDDEFEIFKNMAESEEDARLSTIPGAKVKPYLGFTQVFVDFLNGVEQEKLTSSCDLMQSNKQKHLNGTNLTMELEGDSRNDMIKNMLENRLSDDDDLKFEDQGWNLDRKAEDSFQSQPNGFSVKRKVGRPKGSVRKRDPINDDPDYDENYYENYQPRPRPVSTHNSSGGPPRKRGRPKKIQEDNPYLQMTNLNEDILFSEPDDLGCYTVGSFVVERKHMFNKDMQNNSIFCINQDFWLTNYLPYPTIEYLFHQMAGQCTGYTGDFRSHYKAIQVERTDKPDIVRALVPFGDYEDTSNDPLMESFAMYAQILVYQNFEKTFIHQIIEKKDAHFYDHYTHIDTIIRHCLDSIQQNINFMSYFKNTLDNYPYYKICPLSQSSQHKQCSEIYKPDLTANRIIKFFGPQYDHLYLTFTENTNNTRKRTPESYANEFVQYDIHESSVDFIRLYHAFRHFKFAMFTEAKYKIEEKQIQLSDMKSILFEDNQWIQYRLMMLKNMINQSGLSFVTQQV